MPAAGHHGYRAIDAVLPHDRRDLSVGAAGHPAACGDGDWRGGFDHRIGVLAVAQGGPRDAGRAEHLFGHPMVVHGERRIARVRADARGVHDVLHARSHRRLDRIRVGADALADAHRADHQHLVSADERRGERRRIVEVAAPDLRAQLRVARELAGVARDEDQLFRRHVLQQAFDGRAAEISGCPGHDQCHVVEPLCCWRGTLAASILRSAAPLRNRRS